MTSFTNKFINPSTLTGGQKQLGIALLYLLSGYVINHNFINTNFVCAVWPGTGLALASLLIGGRRYIWGIGAGELLVSALSNDSFPAIAGITLAVVIEALLSVWLLTRNDQPALSLDTLRDYLQLIILGGCVAGIAGAVIGGLAVLFAGYITPADYFGNVLRWWMGDTLGVILITPLILVWCGEKCGQFKIKPLGALLPVGISFLVGQIVFLEWFHEYLSDTPRGFLMFFCVTWVAIRLGSRGVTFVTLMIAIQALLGAYYEIGYFAHDIAGANLYNYWAYMVILSVVGMALATYVNEIKRAEEMLRNLSSHLAMVREDERTRIAREVHDQLGSILTAVKMDLSWLTKQLPEDLFACQEKVAAMNRHIDDAIWITRKIVTDLRPSILDHLGLFAAIDWKFDEFRQQTGMQCVLTIPEEKIMMDEGRDIAVFRIMQEALTNIALHSRATKVKLVVKTGADSLMMQITDNGCGMNLAQMPKAGKYGILGMHERARHFGGEVAMVSNPGKGTSLVLNMPLKSEEIGGYHD